MGLVKTLAFALGPPIIIVLLNEHGFLEFLGGKTKAQALIEHPKKA